MRKSVLAFVVGLTTGAVVGMLIGEKEKKRIQAALVDYRKWLSEQYENLSREGLNRVKAGINKVQELKKEYLG